MNSILFDVVTELKLTRKELVSLLIVILQYADDQPIQQLPQYLQSVFEKAGIPKKRTEQEAKAYAESPQRVFDNPPFDDDVSKLV